MVVRAYKIKLLYKVLFKKEALQLTKITVEKFSKELVLSPQ